MDPFDLIKSLLSSLSDKEKEELAALVGVVPSACMKTGHKFRVALSVPEWNSWFMHRPAYQKLYCERCGAVHHV